MKLNSYSLEFEFVMSSASKVTAGLEASRHEGPRRNVLFIVVDQWRADCMPYLGTPHLKTPNLDRLCREGVTFKNHVTTAVPCGPARASLHTGLYLMNHRSVQNWVPLDARHTTLPKALRSIGYDPALIGYTSTTPDPRETDHADPRFSMIGDDMEGWRPVGSFQPDMDGYFGWLAHKGYELPENRADIWLPLGDDPGATAQPSRIPKELTDSAFFTEHALTYLKGRNGKPFFLHLGYYRPHPPFVASAPYHAMYNPADMPKPVRAQSLEEEAQQHKLLEFYLSNTPQKYFFRGAEGLTSQVDDAAIAQMRATYYGMISEIDDCLGQVFDFLQESGQWDDTLIVFTSDHGEQLGDHHLLGKIGYHDESFRVPLVVKDPSAKLRAGQIEEAFTESVDLMPTMLEWLGGNVPRACDGHSLVPLLHDRKPANWRTEMHYEFDFRDVLGEAPQEHVGLDMDECSLCVIQDASFKYVHFTALPPLLFDLTRDPAQLRSVAEDPDYANIVKTYAQKALSWRMLHADKTLTHYRASPDGLELRHLPKKD